MKSHFYFTIKNWPISEAEKKMIDRFPNNITAETKWSIGHFFFISRSYKVIPLVNIRYFPKISK